MNVEQNKDCYVALSCEWRTDGPEPVSLGFALYKINGGELTNDGQITEGGDLTLDLLLQGSPGESIDSNRDELVHYIAEKEISLIHTITNMGGQGIIGIAGYEQNPSGDGSGNSYVVRRMIDDETTRRLKQECVKISPVRINRD